MSREEFRILIESIGFKYNGLYEYKEFRISYSNKYYNFHNGSKWIYSILLNDLELIEKKFKKELRSVKLKELLR
jgi:hypothetical protein